MRHGWKQVLLAITVVAAGHEAAAAVCFPYAGGVPGESGSGPPDWWSAGASTTGTETTTFLEDPRWRGAFGAMALSNSKFRVLVENSHGVQSLVMMFEVTGDATTTTGGDRLYFGVWDDASSTGNIFRFTRNRITAASGARWSATPASSAFAGRVFGGAVVSGTTTWTAAPAASTLPTWMTSDTRVEVICASGVCDRWAFRVRATIDPTANTAAATPTGVKISTGTPRNFHFWYEVQDSGAIGTSLYSYPTGLTPPASEAGGTLSVPDPSGWKAAQLGTGASCDGDILFNSGDVYVNSMGSTQLDLTSNTFHATPTHNAPGMTISNSELTAKFRIANWGSAGFDSPEWTETCTATGSGTNVTYPNDFNRSCTWTGFASCPYKPAGDSCGATAGTKDPHQCVLVDLGLGTTTRNYSFSVQSVFKNMDFDVNSTLVRHATIDIKGLGPMPGGEANRDVYLYVHTNNMPAKIADEAPAPADDQGGDRRTNVLPPRQRFKELQLPATGAIGTKDSARIQAAVQARQMTLEQVEQIMPTYIVYVWHDTGRTLATATGPSKILEAQPSFGLYLAHDGAIEGWKHELTAAGATKVGPNLYKFSPPNDSTFPVTITIAPIEPSLTWLWILLVLLLLILIAYVLLRRKPTPPGP